MRKPPRLEPLASTSYAQYPSQTAEEILVLKAIVTREMCLDQLVGLATSFAATPVQLLESVLALRDASLAVVEAIATWRSYMVRPMPFLWHGINYMWRMVADSDFLSKSSHLHLALEFKLKRRNPFCTIPALDTPFRIPRDDPHGLMCKGSYSFRLQEASMYLLEEEARNGGPYKPPCTDSRWAYMVQREAEHITQLRFGKNQ
ncbi:Aste57867_14189 [Aphanomyces stellatus]|uniref:Aste57867_14189 protein n=1 Tax=Aphanomyces stellatus TaxID=120398 RepID=A0A485L004_9STRA|nr:hypothetical protein As57867_014138 [Aphanomyces stellatus]VFT91014.1 Aste57867_14189 [Aphanomyces stellatus]